MSELAGRLRAGGAAVTDVGSGLSVLRLVGPASPAILERACPVDLSTRSVGDQRIVQAPVVGVRMVVARQDHRRCPRLHPARRARPRGVRVGRPPRPRPRSRPRARGRQRRDPTMIGPLRKIRVLRPRPLKSRYDVVIIGGGVHGLAIAYELAKRGVKGVAVLDRSYIGSGASGRNTAIIRSNYRTIEGVSFYDESVRIYEGLSAELGFNVLFSQRGHLTFAHTELAIAGLRVRAETNQLLGVDSRVIDRAEIARLVPGARPVGPASLPGARGPLPPAGRHHPPRRGRLGLRATGRGAGRGHPPEHRGHRHRAGRRPCRGRLHAGRPDRRRDGRERDRRLGLDDRRDGGPAAPDRDPSAPGARDRTPEALPRPGARLRDAPRLRQPDRPRRARHRLGDRSLRLVQPALDAPVRGDLRSPRPGAAPERGRRQGPAAVGRESAT